MHEQILALSSSASSSEHLRFSCMHTGMRLGPYRLGTQKMLRVAAVVWPVCTTHLPKQNCLVPSKAIGAATRCDAVYPRWDVPMHLRCSNITCDALWCIFKHVGNFAPDIVRFSSDLQHNIWQLVSFYGIWDSIFLRPYYTTRFVTRVLGVTRVFTQREAQTRVFGENA